MSTSSCAGIRSGRIVRGRLTLIQQPISSKNLICAGTCRTLCGGRLWSHSSPPELSVPFTAFGRQCTATVATIKTNALSTGARMTIGEVQNNMSAEMEKPLLSANNGVEAFDPSKQSHIPHAVKKYSKANKLEDVPHAKAAWEWYNTTLKSPKYWVAPMVDQSELAFRLLCKAHGADAAYTPMLHARLFSEKESYREENFGTCPEEDQPLLAQFCANDPEVLLAAARYVEPYVDGVDINLGCPQRIASRGRYGAYLMDDIPLIESMVSILAENLSVPVTVKIRRFPGVEETVEYAARLEKAGASLVAVHGRLRGERRAKSSAACWETIAAVKQALHVPVLANGNLRNLYDAKYCLEFTGADGVMSAESLLEDPALFSPKRLEAGGEFKPKDGPQLLLEYCDLIEKYPTPARMVKGHAFSMLGPWLTEFVDMREELRIKFDPAKLREFTTRLIQRVEETGREYPIPAISKRKLEAMRAEEAKEAAIAEQEKESQALAELDAKAS